MPQWIHARAEHILAKNPSMPKSMAFALATQQSHALGKSPKGYGTEKGRETAKMKYTTPGDDEGRANPGKLDSPKMEKGAVSEEWAKRHVLSALRKGVSKERYARFADKMVGIENRAPLLHRRADVAGEARNLIERYNPYDYPGGKGIPKVGARMVKRAWQDALPGGRADRSRPSDFSYSALRAGARHEAEHTRSKHLQKEIAMDHLKEDPDYYEKLKKVEKTGMNHIEIAAFNDELQKIAGLGDVLQSVKNVALTNVGGPKGLLTPLGQVTRNASMRPAPIPKIERPHLPTRKSPSGAYDVSAMAERMGV